MGSMADLPLKLLTPPSFDNVKEIAFRTIPSASKVEIKTVLESMYGFQVEKVRTLNMQGKKKRGGGRLVARPNYKKAYVTLKNRLSLSSHPAHDPAHALKEEKSAPKLPDQLLPRWFVDKQKKLEPGAHLNRQINFYPGGVLTGRRSRGLYS